MVTTQDAAPCVGRFDLLAHIQLKKIRPNIRPLLYLTFYQNTYSWGKAEVNLTFTVKINITVILTLNSEDDIFNYYYF